MRESRTPSPIHDFHTHTVPAWEAMLDACAKAKMSIDLEQYIIQPDDIGTKFVNILCRKAKEDVKIRLLLDWWGSRAFLKSELCEHLKAEGVKVQVFRSPRWMWILSGPRFFPRDHRKLLIIDNDVSFLGGVCIYDTISTWRDTMVEMHDGLTKQLAFIFHSTWCKAEGKAIDAHPDFETDEFFSIYANNPEKNHNHFTENLLEKIGSAQDSVKLTTPYFSPTQPLLRSLGKVLARGVKLQILLSNQSNHVSYVVGKKIAGELIQQGAEIYYYEPVMLHLKMMIVDKSWTAIGSCNLDGLSLHQNLEAMLTATDDSCIHTLLEHFEEDKSKSKRFSYENWRTRPLSEKLMGNLYYPMRRYM